MKLLRNNEVRLTLLLLIFFSVICVLIGTFLGTKCAIFALIICICFIAFYIVITYIRYKKMRALSCKLDEILHGDSSISLDEYNEGDVGILQSEIYKMTVMLRESRATLQREKVYLANSLADISHQLRTPLTSINLILTFLSEPELDERCRGEHIRRLYYLISRIDSLITSLLKISKLDAQTVEFKQALIPVSELIEQSTASLLVPIELRKQNLSITASGNLLCDVSWTAEALSNIVKNCMEHTPQGGNISITATEYPLGVKVVISDDGCGISPRDLPHIFERFYKGENSSSDSFGIGLNLARSIITSQGGTIKAENNAGSGAKFTVVFYKMTV